MPVREPILSVRREREAQKRWLFVNGIMAANVEQQTYKNPGLILFSLSCGRPTLLRDDPAHKSVK